MGGATASSNQEKEPNVASDAFNFMGERAPAPRAPQMESKPAQIVAGFYNGAVAPTIDFMASPAGLATSAIPFAGQAASRIASAAFAPVAFKGMEEARQRANVVAKDPNATLQQKVEPIAEAATQGLMGIGAATHAIPAPEIGKLGITPNKGRTAKSMEEIDKGLEEAASPVTQFPTSEKGFYSQLQKVLHEKMPNNASVDQIRAIIDPAKGSGVKPDEIKWSNLEGFLEGKKNATKQEVLDYLKNEGAVKFEEMTLGQPSESEIESLLSDEMGAGMDRQDAIDYLSRDEGSTKYSQYTLPNGENYREFVLTMPEGMGDLNRIAQSLFGKNYSDLTEQSERRKVVKETREKGGQIPDSYRSSHFSDIPNYVAHMRLNERPDSDGNKGLFIEELQSDRHQAGREKGYVDPQKAEEMKRLGKIERELSDQAISMKRKLLEEAIDVRESPEYQSLQEKIRENSDQIRKLNDEGGATGILDAPFRKDWHTQLFKRALRDAVDKGHDWIGWTSGDTQAGRYDLSKQVRDISYRPNDGELQARGIDGGRAISKSGVTPDKLESFVGKEVAKKLLEQPKGEHFSRADGMGMGWHTLSGQDLKVGGEGMKGFYDKMLPNEIGKYVKKWGAKVEQGSIEERADDATWKVEYPNGRRGTVYTEDAAESAREAGAKVTPSETKQTPIWKVKITPEMRKSIQQGGQPQVSKDTDIFANLV
jgi:hypothetical protein